MAGTLLQRDGLFVHESESWRWGGVVARSSMLQRLLRHVVSTFHPRGGQTARAHEHRLYDKRLVLPLLANLVQ
jgi:hypothetical protein